VPRIQSLATLSPIMAFMVSTRWTFGIWTNDEPDFRRFYLTDLGMVGKVRPAAVIHGKTRTVPERRLYALRTGALRCRELCPSGYSGAG
jgi:hypothetical protein